MNQDSFVIAFLVSVLMIIGCTNVGMSKKQFNKKMQNIEVGMSKEAFLKILPKAEPRGAKAYSKGTVEVLAVAVSEYHFYPTGEGVRNPVTGNESRAKWFYFFQNKLIQYGNPEDWPKEADLTIEVQSH